MLSTGKQRGFTIVELLIVIVVIAILASITIVSFSGIQQRARNMARISAAKAILTSAQLYAAQNGASTLRSMLTLNGRATCIGTDYEDVSPTSDYTCRYAEYTNTAPISSLVNQDIYTALQSAAKYNMHYSPVTQTNFSNVVKVVSSAPFLQGSNYTTSGLRYTLNGGPQQDYYVLLSYRLEGVNQDCSLPVVRQDAASGGVVNYTTGHPYSVVNGGATECWVWMDW